jgi:aspartate kinase
MAVGFLFSGAFGSERRVSMLVMKFGGTSVACAESIARVGRIVRERLHLRPVVVVSALAGVTDSLHTMGALSRDGQLEEALSLLEASQDRHRETAKALLPNTNRGFFEDALRPLFDEARALLKAVFAVQELTPRTLDRLLGFGERWSSCLVAEALCTQGLRAVHVDACDVIITDSNYSHAAPLMDLIEARVASSIRPRVQSGCVPVLGGFIGSTEDGIATTLGRGGSDFTASILGASLNAESIEIWTDVDGMMTADPRICPDAQNIESISFDEAAELAHFGAKVLHPKTLQPAMDQGIPVYVLNSRHPENCGTRVEVTEASEEGRVRSVACKRGITGGSSGDVTIQSLIAAELAQLCGSLERVSSRQSFGQRRRRQRARVAGWSKCSAQSGDLRSRVECTAQFADSDDLSRRLRHEPELCCCRRRRG